MLHFKVIYGHRDDEIIPIDDSDYANALYAQFTETSVLFREGVPINGKHIITTLPDWHTEAGIPREEKLLEADKRRIGSARNQEYWDFMKKQGAVVLEDIKREKLNGNQRKTPELPEART